MSWRQERRADRAAEAEQARRDAHAAAERRIAERAALAEQSRLDSEAAAGRARAERAERRAVLGRCVAAVRGFVTAHRVVLLIAPLALASAVLAVPAMAVFGMRVYGSAAGVVLPVLTELGMWAFALAVTERRRTAPEASVWGLVVGVWTFAAVGFTLNALHGAERGPSAAVVMGVASVAGVVAHQLVTATRPRSRVERQQARKVARVRRAAVRDAAAELDADGAAWLVFTPGRYALHRDRPHRRARLVAAIDLTTPPTPHTPGSGTGGSGSGASDPAALDLWVADEVADWLAAQDRPGTATGGGTQDRGPVATLDPDDPHPDRGSGGDEDQRESRPKPRRASKRQKRDKRARRSIPSPATRSIPDLRAELRHMLDADPAAVDVGSAESIRKALRCSPARARQLRDEHQ